MRHPRDGDATPARHGRYTSATMLRLPRLGEATLTHRLGDDEINLSKSDREAVAMVFSKIFQH